MMVYRSAIKQRTDWATVYPVSTETQVYRKTLSNPIMYGHSLRSEAEHLRELCLGD